MSHLQAQIFIWLGVLLLTYFGLKRANRVLDGRRQRERARFAQEQAEIEAAIRSQLAKLKRPAPPAWTRVLGLSLPVDKQQVQHAFRELSKQRHPDVGGSDALMQQLIEARDQALSWVRATAPA